MDQSLDTSLQKQMASLQQLVKHLAEQPSLLQQQADAINTSPQLQPEPQPVAQSAAIRPRPILPDPDTFDGSDHALYPEFRSKLDAKLTLIRQHLAPTMRCYDMLTTT